mgnify:CR=1 FL=1
MKAVPRPFAVIGITYFIVLALLMKTRANTAFAVLLFCCAAFIASMLIGSIRQAVVLPVAFLAETSACLLFLCTEAYVYKPALKLAGENVFVKGTVTDLPAKEYGRWYYTLKTRSVNNESVRVKIRLSCPRPIDAQPFDTVEMQAVVYVLGGESDDAVLRLKSAGVYLGAYTRQDIKVTSAEKKPPMYYVLKLKQVIGRNISELLPDENGGLITALLLGDKSRLSNRTSEDFREIGISHVVAVSGLNLSIFLLIFINIFERARLNKKAVYAASSGFVLLVMALAGFSPSVMRAGAMLLLFLFGKLINKEADAVNSLGFSVMALTLFDPFGAGNLGLQLSFFATLGILLVQKKLMRPIDRALAGIKNKPIKKFGIFLGETLTVTTASSLFTLPVMIVSFGRVSLISLAANVLLVYASTASMITGGLSALLWSIPHLHVFAYPLAFAAGILAKYILACSRLLAAVPYAGVYAGEGYVLLWLSGTLLLLSLSAALAVKRQKSRIGLVLVLSTAMLVSGVLSHLAVNRNITKITVADIGNASAAVITKRGNAVLLGCGGEALAASKIISILDGNNVRNTQLLLIPRPEESESGAAADILNAVAPQKIVAPFLNDELQTLSRDSHVTFSSRYKTDLWDNARIEYMYEDDVSCAYTDLEGTTVLFVFYPGVDPDAIPSAWLCADVLVCRSKPPARMDCRGFGAVVIAGEEPALRTADAINIQGGNAAATASLGDIVIKTTGDSVFSVGRC